MSVIVKGMAMPPSCYFCALTDTSFIRCEAFRPTKLLEDDCEERRPKWCPLVEVEDDTYGITDGWIPVEKKLPEEDRLSLHVIRHSKADV
jgi:hypothetical protein